MSDDPKTQRSVSDRIPPAARAAHTPEGTAGVGGSGEVSSRRRRHKAMGARVAATGLGAGAMLGIVGAFGAHAASTGATTKAASGPRVSPTTAAPRHTVLATTPTTIVWRVVHRTVVVIDPPASSGSSYGGGARSSYSGSSYSGSSYTQSYSRPASTPGYAAPQPAAAPAPVATPAPAPAPAPPACSGSKCP